MIYNNLFIVVDASRLITAAERARIECALSSCVSGQPLAAGSQRARLTMTRT